MQGMTDLDKRNAEKLERLYAAIGAKVHRFLREAETGSFRVVMEINANQGGISKMFAEYAERGSV